MQNLLYDEEHKRTDVYAYKVNQGGELNIRLSHGSARYVEIRFENGKFQSCKFPFDGIYERQHWHILAAINRQISALEARYAEAAKWHDNAVYATAPPKE